MQYNTTTLILFIQQSERISYLFLHAIDNNCSKSLYSNYGWVVSFDKGM